MSAVSLMPKGTTFVRSLITAHNVSTGDPERYAAFAEANWGPFHAKAVVSALGTGDFGSPQADEFFDLVRDQSLIGRLLGLRRVPFGVRMISVVNGASAYWIGEGNWIPVSKPALEGSTLQPLKVATLIVATKEAMRANSKAEAVLLSDMQRAVTASLDGAFLDSTNAGVPEQTPPSITFGAPAVSATADPAADLAALVSLFQGDFSQAYFVTDPITATRLALARDAGGSFAFPDVGPRGGSVLGIPLLVSRGSPHDSNGGQIALIDPTSIAGNMDDIRVETSDQTTLQMRSDPTDPATTMVSLFTTNSVSWKTLVSANWEVQRAGAVAVIAGASY